MALFTTVHLTHALLPSPTPADWLVHRTGERNDSERFSRRLCEDSDVESQQLICPTCLQRQRLKEQSILGFIGFDVSIQASFVSTVCVPVSNSQRNGRNGAILLNYIILGSFSQFVPCLRVGSLER